MCRFKHSAINRQLKIYFYAIAITVPFSFVLTVSDASYQFSFSLDKSSLTSNKYISVLQNETKINGLSETNQNEKSSLIVKTINKRSLGTTVYGLSLIHI